MAIKCDIEEVKGDIGIREYPYIGKNRNNEIIVYFIEKNTGIPLSNSNRNACYTSLDEANYDIFKGKVTLSND